VGCNIVDPTSWASCPGNLFKSVAGDAFATIARDFGQAADSAINWLWVQISSATVVSLSGPAFETDLGIVAAIAGVVAVGLFVVQVGLSALRRDAGGLVRALKGMVVAFVGAGIAIGAVSLLLAATDDLSAGIVQAATGGSVQQMGEALLAAGTISAASNNPAVIIVLAVAALAAVVVVWGALMVRKALIVVTAVFAPLAFAGSLADITVGWTRRWVETTLALVASKLLLVLVFMVGLGLFGGMGEAGSGAGQTITQAITGLLVLALAGFSPWVALKLVHFVGDQAHNVHLLATSSSAGASRAYSAARKAEGWVTAAATGGTGRAAAAGASMARPSSAQVAAPTSASTPPSGAAPGTPARATATIGTSGQVASLPTGSEHAAATAPSSAPAPVPPQPSGQPTPPSPSRGA
jgi:hypothetical protein